MRSRFRYLALFAAPALLLGVTGRTAHAADDPVSEGLATVRVEYTDLLRYFYKPLDPDTLLTAGWQALQQSSAAKKAPIPELGALPEDADGAFVAFAARYRQFAARLPKPSQARGYAFVVADGIAASLHEQHTQFVPFAGVGFDEGEREMEWGAGLHTTDHAPWIVTELAPDGQAKLAGVKPGDVIADLDGAPVPDDAEEGFVDHALSEDEQTVKVTVDRDGARSTYALKGGWYAFPTLTTRMLPGNVGYVRLREFATSRFANSNGKLLLTDLDQQLGQLERSGAKGLVLDLRDNPGGSVATADGLLGRFLPDTALTITHYDERGHLVAGVASGPMRRVQLPLAVLINGNSASSSESVASTLHEAGRAVLVGERSAGALATAEFLPLPGVAALQIAMAEVRTARSGESVDRQGLAVDVEAPDGRTAADFRDGRDPQLDAAAQALASAPTPPVYSPNASPIPSEAIYGMLNVYAPDMDWMQLGDRKVAAHRTAVQSLNSPNPIVDVSSADPLALAQTMRSRGWLGRQSQDYVIDLEDALGLTATFDLYATPDGAAAALAANDFPELQQPITPSFQLDRPTAAYRGEWMRSGTTTYSWQRGNVVVSVAYAAAPGSERDDAIKLLAEGINALFDRYPLRMDPVQALLAQASATAAQPTFVATQVAPPPADDPAVMPAPSHRTQNDDPIVIIAAVAIGAGVLLATTLGRRRVA
ncbi:MAG TPA: S41 family peptidase [Dehalococcoidia bacterium]|nr:S41 family peptidase [Dehalococcoidia bacterium]